VVMGSIPNACKPHSSPTRGPCRGHNTTAKGNALVTLDQDPLSPERARHRPQQQGRKGSS
jgi:hypothetical protein